MFKGSILTLIVGVKGVCTHFRLWIQLNIAGVSNWILVISWSLFILKCLSMLKYPWENNKCNFGVPEVKNGENFFLRLFR